MQTFEACQQQVKRSFDKKAMTRVFKEGDLIIKWDVDRANLGRNSKFDAMWSGPYVITSCKEANAFQLFMYDGDVLPILVNKTHLKP